MEEATLVEQLVAFGLGRQEAVIYLCLMKNGEMTGYEVAKYTGISRSNVYNGLAALVEHGAAHPMEGASTKYVAVAVEQFCDNHIRYLSGVREELSRNCPKPKMNAQRYITIEGSNRIRDKIHHMLLGATKRIYFSASSEIINDWQKEIGELLSRDIKVVLISDNVPTELEEKLKNKVIFYRSISGEEDAYRKDKQDRIRLIIDSEYVLTGELTGSSSDTCLYSEQENFVDILKEAMHNEIKLIELSGHSQIN